CATTQIDSAAAQAEAVGLAPLDMNWPRVSRGLLFFVAQGAEQPNRPVSALSNLRRNTLTENYAEHLRMGLCLFGVRVTLERFCPEEAPYVEVACIWCGGVDYLRIDRGRIDHLARLAPPIDRQRSRSSGRLDAPRVDVWRPIGSPGLKPKLASTFPIRRS